MVIKEDETTNQQKKNYKQFEMRVRIICTM